MSSEKPAVPKPGAGIASSPATTLFRITNFELYAKPNKFIMITGATAFMCCAVYLYEMRKYAKSLTTDTVQTSSDGKYSYVKKSKWD